MATNWSGWATALLTAGILATAFYGLRQAQPIFQNQLLEEQIAKKELELRRLSDRLLATEARNWKFVVNQYLDKVVIACCRFS